MSLSIQSDKTDAMIISGLFVGRGKGEMHTNPLPDRLPSAILSEVLHSDHHSTNSRASNILTGLQKANPYLSAEEVYLSLFSHLKQLQLSKSLSFSDSGSAELEKLCKLEI